MECLIARLYSDYHKGPHTHNGDGNSAIRRAVYGSNQNIVGLLVINWFALCQRWHTHFSGLYIYVFKDKRFDLKMNIQIYCVRPFVDSLPVLTNLNVTLLCDLMVSLNVICVQSFKIPDEVAIIRVVVVVCNDGYSLRLLIWLLLEVPDKAPPLRQLLNRLRLVFVTLSIFCRCRSCLKHRRVLSNSIQNPTSSANVVDVTFQWSRIEKKRKQEKRRTEKW